MRMRTLMACLIAVVFSAGLSGCSVSLSGSASLSSDGSTAILKGQDPLEVRAAQPELPPPPPPPKKAKITEKAIEIMEKVQFEKNEAKILDVSHDLLNDVADIMKEHIEVKKIRIEGHASSEGGAKYNKKLSDRRAKAVMEYLVSVGVDPERMEAIGFGIEKPIASNDTEEGREKNRRVEFNIVARLSKEELEEAKKVAGQKAAAAAASKAASEASEQQTENRQAEAPEGE
jgi:outer membrane protein OmpA-like peptidoglycan-associated protein